MICMHMQQTRPVPTMKSLSIQPGCVPALPWVPLHTPLQQKDKDRHSANDREERQ